MIEPLLEVSLPAVLVATLLQMLLGMVWYGPGVFGREWMALTGKSKEDGEKSRHRGIILSGIASFLTALFLAWLFSYMPVSTLWEAIGVAVIVWVGFMLTGELHGVAWEQRPVPLLWINAGWSLTGMVLTAIVLYAWPW